MAGRPTAILLSAIIAGQNCLRMYGEEACQCRYNGLDIQHHDSLLGAHPTPIEGTKKVQCPFMKGSDRCTFKCDKTRPTDMARHQSAVHAQVRPFKCTFEGCGKAFKQHPHLRTHLRTHSVEVDSCCFPGCEFTCKDRSAWIRHWDAKHSDVEIPGVKRRNRGDGEPSPRSSKRRSPNSQPMAPAPATQPVLSFPAGQVAPGQNDIFALEQSLPYRWGQDGIPYFDTQTTVDNNDWNLDIQIDFPALVAFNSGAQEQPGQYIDPALQSDTPAWQPPQSATDFSESFRLYSLGATSTFPGMCFRIWNL